MEWKVVERPGYFGTSRNQIHARYDAQFGRDNWRIAWQWEDEIIQRPEALLIYQRGYAEHLKTSPKLLEWLLNYEDVYDTAPSNVQSRFNYDIQETENNHIHDIALRRAVILDLGFVFRKKRGLLHIRPGREGEVLGPYLVPFHLPGMIYRGVTKYKGEDRDFSVDPPWWTKMGIKDSLEQFYQQNKVLEVKR